MSDNTCVEGKEITTPKNRDTTHIAALKFTPTFALLLYHFRPARQGRKLGCTRSVLGLFMLNPYIIELKLQSIIVKDRCKLCVIKCGTSISINFGVNGIKQKNATFDPALPYMK